MTRNGPRNINNHCREMDRALKRNPPVIVWERNKRGVMVAVEVRDPHAETSAQAQAERMRSWADRADRKAAAAEMEEARLRVVELMRTETDEVQNTSLMTAARNPL